MLCQKTRAVCLREIQNSIKESVKQNIEDAIRDAGVGSLFTITDSEIRGPNNSLAIFKGLQTSQKGGGSALGVRSLKGFNRAWVEEAQAISASSLETLTPTIRRDKGQDDDPNWPELWFSWNPMRADDPVEKFFQQRKDDPNTICVEVNYWDNPWFPEDLRKDMEWDKRDPDKYAHVWCGKYKTASELRVFKNWRVGKDDEFVYNEGTLRNIKDAPRAEIDRLAQLFDTIPGAKKWKIRADSADPQVISYLNRHGYPNIMAAIKGKGSVEEGIEFLQSYDIVVHPRCEHVIRELSFYSWKKDEHTNDPIPVLMDTNNHTIDALRYALEGARRAPLNITDRVLARAAQPQQFERVWR